MEPLLAQHGDVRSFKWGRGLESLHHDDVAVAPIGPAFKAPHAPEAATQQHRFRLIRDPQRVLDLRGEAELAVQRE